MRAALLGLLLCSVVFAEKGLRPDGSLDMSSLRVTFREGELDLVKNILESFLKNEGQTATKDEKIFAYKYLGVIYAANPAERAKAESYFSLLLPLAPNIELVDMYVSDDIQAVFDKVKSQYQHTQEYRAHFDAFGNPLPGSKRVVANSGPETKPVPAAKPDNSEIEPKEPSHAWVWWTAGITAAVVGTGAVIWMVEANKSSPTHLSSGI